MFAKACFVLFFVCIMVGSASANPQKRLTCEFGGVQACAAHCILLGYTGGWCDGHNYCHCKTSGKREAETA
uniref:Defensin n=1 Tax=Ruditapes philippinarum TaxID=129788 RepID=G0Z5N3_RUDPH|nr:defensin [Ruditapes philippinarum]APY18897.1 defensin [Ruditapes philippinarum]